MDEMEMKQLYENVTELIKLKRFVQLQSLLDTLNPADIAEMSEDLLDDEVISQEELILLFRILPKDLAADTFVEMDSDMQEVLIRSFSDRELREVMDDIYVDDTVDIIEEMPANVVTRILKNVDAETRKSVNQILKYPEDSAGSIMTTEFVSLKPENTVRESFARIRESGVDKETIYTCYVTKNKELIGVVTARELLLADYEDKISDIMEENVISVNTMDDQEAVARMFDKYDFTAIPVTDNENRLVGIVTVDDAIDVINEEATEDMEKMAALTPSEHPYLKTGVGETFRQRIPWLLLLMVSATFTGLIITHFESALAAQAILTAFIPMLMDTGGNSGSQASVTIIRGLSVGDIEFKDITSVIWKETKVALLCGAVLSAVAFAKILLVDGMLMKNPDISVPIAATVAFSLVCTVFIAKLIGCVLPIFAKKLGLDPAVMAAPIITTIIDALSLMIYMNVAASVLGL